MRHSPYQIFDVHPGTSGTSMKSFFKRTACNLKISRKLGRLRKCWLPQCWWKFEQLLWIGNNEETSILFCLTPDIIRKIVGILYIEQPTWPLHFKTKNKFKTSLKLSNLGLERDTSLSASDYPISWIAFQLENWVWNQEILDSESIGIVTDTDWRCLEAIPHLYFHEVDKKMDMASVHKAFIDYYDGIMYALDRW